MQYQEKKYSLLLSFLKYFEVAKVNYFNSTAYMLNLLSRSISVLLRIWVFTQLYKVSFSVSGDNRIGGLTVSMVIWGLMLTQSFQSSTRPVISRIIDEEVKTGTIAHSMNKPYSYILFHYAGFMGRCVPNLCVNIVMGSVSAFLLVGTVKITLTGFLAGIVLLFLGLALDFIIAMVIGLMAFWVEDTSAFIWIYSKGQLVLGGLILPIALFPDYLRKIAEILPFSQMYYSAARVIVNFDSGLFIQFAATQLIWIALLGYLALRVFRKGIRHVSVNGG